MGESSKECIACAEVIRARALLCRYCGTLQDDPMFLRRSKQDPESDSKNASTQISTKAVDAQRRIRDETQRDSDTSGHKSQYSCGHCGSEIYAEWSFCDVCGTKAATERNENLSDEKPIEAVNKDTDNEYIDIELTDGSADTLVSETPSEDLLLACHSCGADIEESWSFCDQCGTKHESLEAAIEAVDDEIESDRREDFVAAILCPYCDQKIDESFNYCDSCGRNLAELPDTKNRELAKVELEENDTQVSGENKRSQFLFVNHAPHFVNWEFPERQQTEVESEESEHQTKPDRNKTRNLIQRRRFLGFVPVLGIVAGVSVFALLGQGLMAPADSDSSASDTAESQSVFSEANKPESQVESNFTTPNNQQNSEGPQANELPLESDSADASSGVGENSVNESMTADTPGNSGESADQGSEPQVSSGDIQEEPEEPAAASDDERFLAPGWDYWPDVFDVTEPANKVESLSDWDNQYFFEASTAAKLVDSVTVGRNVNGIGFCEPGVSPGLGSYKSFFSSISEGDIETCQNAKGTVFVFITDSEWLADQYGTSLRGEFATATRLNWAIGRPICSPSPFAMIALEDFGVPLKPPLSEDWRSGEFYPQILALPAWDYIETGRWTGTRASWAVDSCGENCFEHLFETKNPQNASCQLLGDG